MKSIFLFLIFSLFISSCSDTQMTIEKFEQRMTQIQKQYAPDQSLNVFSVELEQKDGKWTAAGQTTLPEAKKAVIKFADSLLEKGGYSDQVELLPQAELGDSIFALVKHAFGHLRRHPKNSAELLDQAVLGSELKLLQRKRSWYRVQTNYGYIGWMKRFSLHRTDEAGVSAWKNGELQRVTKLMDFVYGSPSEKSEILSSAVLNASMLLAEKGLKWSKVILPDGEQGYIKTGSIESWEKTYSRKISADRIVKTAKSMMGLPYLWGGNSSTANDCSGFTQTVFKANGMQLPRDARQQVLMGEEIIPKENFSNVRAGDLLFFGRTDSLTMIDRITHVAISLGGYEFIHQDSDAHIDSFDENAPNFNSRRKKSLKKIKRFINE